LQEKQYQFENGGAALEVFTPALVVVLGTCWTTLCSHGVLPHTSVICVRARE
jgi:hypothetical protein